MISYLELLKEDERYLLFFISGLITIILLILILRKESKRKKSIGNYNDLIWLIQDSLKKGLKKLDYIKDISLKEDLILKGKKDLDRTIYDQVRSCLVTDYFLKQLLNQAVNGDVKEKRKAALTLVEIGTSQAIDYLISLLYDESEEIRRLVIGELSRFEAPKVITTLINYLDYCEDVSTLTIVKEAFINLGDKSVPKLLEILRSENKVYVTWAIELLGEIGDKRAINPLIDLLYNHQEVEVRIVAAKNLFEFDTPKTFKALIYKIEDDSCQVRAQIAKLLGVSGRRQSIPYLYKMTTDSSGIVRNNACEALLHFKDEGIKYLILAVDQEDIAPEVIKALEKLDTIKLIQLVKNIYQAEEVSEEDENLDLFSLLKVDKSEKLIG